MDDLDRANDLTELERIQSIQAARYRANKQEVPRTGWCINECGEPTLGVFCSMECRTDYNRRKANNQ